MENNYNSVIRLAMAICIILFTYTNSSFAQGSYSGGQGGGYSSYAIGTGTSVITEVQIENKKIEATIYPNPLSSSDVLKAKLLGFPIGQKINVVITDMIGSRLHFEEIEIADEVTINLSHDRFSKGIYLITFQHNNLKITRRFSYKE
jgi:FAD synthase